VNMKIKRSTEKLEMSFRDIPIFSSNSLKDVQLLANLKTLSSLTDLNAEIVPPEI